jgi:DNA replication and repair protein RecF
VERPVRLDRLTALGWRNLQGPPPDLQGATDRPLLEWQLHARFNLVVGDNGQGKTNLLEAIAVLAGLRSFRTARLQDGIAFGQSTAVLAAKVFSRGVASQLGLELTARGRRTLVDGKTAASAAQFLGRLTAVVFTPADLALPHAEPEARRRWLDRVVFNHQPAHLDELRRYEQALTARNAVLRAHAAGKISADPALIDVYDQLLARHGAEVMRRRREVLGVFVPVVQRVFAEIAAPGLTCDIRYLPKDDAGDEADLQRALLQRRPRDLQAGHTTRGPHRDDVALEIAGRPAAIHASQGQCRALVLAGKIAEIASLEATLGEAPLLLLDDVSSELDARRNAALMAHLDELGGQVVLTTTAAEHIRVAAPRQIFYVQSGHLTQGPVLADASAAALATPTTMDL